MKYQQDPTAAFVALSASVEDLRRRLTKVEAMLEQEDSREVDDALDRREAMERFCDEQERCLGEEDDS